MTYISAMTYRDEVHVWERHGDTRLVRKYPAPYYFYVDDPAGKYKTIFDTPVKKLQFDTAAEFRQARQDAERTRFATGITAWESDIAPELRVLSNNYYNKPTNSLNTTFMDIEVDYDKTRGFSSPENPYAPINSISMFHYWSKKLMLYVVPPPGQDWTSETLLAAVNAIEPIPSQWDIDFQVCENEFELLVRTAVALEDTDIWCGWNSEMFDFPYLMKRAEIVLHDEGGMELFNFPNAPVPRFQEVELFGQPRQKVNMVGRVLLDYMQLIKKFEPGERESFKLAAVEEDVGLNLPKLEYEGSLADLYVDNLPYFVRYNIRDSEILCGFEDQLGYVEVANLYVHMATGQFSHVLGTLRLADLTIVNECHHELKRVVPNNRMPDIDRSIMGAFVVESVVGHHFDVANVDLTSLYPSCLRALNGSPETIIGQFKGEFDDSESIWKREDKELTFVWLDGREETKHINDWVREFTVRGYSISGFGVAFDQNRPGIIPTVLTNWFGLRVQYKNDMKKKGATQAEIDYADRLQYVYKIRLNSLYGALSNQMFRFYDLRVAESTTSTGRMVAWHQRAKVNEIIHGQYVDLGLAVLAGDTDSVYFKLDVEREDSDDVKVARADEIARIVNESFPEFMTKAFLCNAENSTVMGSARENVIASVIFVEKKRYIALVIDCEGKRKEFFKVTGLDIKKTTLPRAIGIKIEELVRRILRGEEWDNIAKSTIELKDELRSRPFYTLGLPKGLNKGLEVGTTAELADPNARLPGHVRAGILYNKMLKEHNDLVSMKAASGMKIRIFYLKKPIGKFNSICLPTDLEVIPDWFKNMEDQIDVESQITRLVDNPFENILKAIGRQAPTRQSILIDELVEF